jgi:hypothetical protein
VVAGPILTVGEWKVVIDTLTAEELGNANEAILRIRDKIRDNLHKNGYLR